MSNEPSKIAEPPPAQRPPGAGASLVRRAARELMAWRARPRRIRWGGFRRLEPVSRKFGGDRGLAICHFYIRRFLKEYQSDIRGRVLEIGDDRYTRLFAGDRIAGSDVLHVTADNPKATIVGDLVEGVGIPSEAFDCIIFTQTLQHIFDVKAAIATLYRILKPGGVLLATFPGIGQISRYDMDRWGDFWRFTTASAERLFGAHWPEGSCSVQSHGNVMVAAAYLFGLASTELTAAELTHTDPDYQVIITVRAVRPSGINNAAPIVSNKRTI